MVIEQDQSECLSGRLGDYLALYFDSPTSSLNLIPGDNNLGKPCLFYRQAFFIVVTFCHLSPQSPICQQNLGGATHNILKGIQDGGQNNIVLFCDTLHFNWSSLVHEIFPTSNDFAANVRLYVSSRVISKQF